MLFMIRKPRPTPAERATAALSAALSAAVSAGRSHGARAAGAAATVLDAVLTGPFRALENRRLLHAMEAMSDRDLRDIGLTRGDLRDVLALPAGGDGSRFLAGRRDARRRAR